MFIKRSLSELYQFFRKPPILPPSKKVLYTVSHKDWEKPAYVEELLWRRHVYNNAMESLRKVFAQEIKQKEREGLAIESLRKQELEELDILIAENERRNMKLAEERFVNIYCFYMICNFQTIERRTRNGASQAINIR